jgi:hypothetical protein
MTDAEALVAIGALVFLSVAPRKFVGIPYDSLRIRVGNPRQFVIMHCLVNIVVQPLPG